MAKAPRLGKLHRYFPNWWHPAEPKALSMESFQPRPEPSADQQHKSRFEKLAEIALHTPQGRDKDDKQAA
jgi:hypothetical protein